MISSFSIYRESRRRKTSGGERNITAGDTISVGRTIQTTIEQICRFLRRMRRFQYWIESVDNF
jgi:hypothetical protein